MKKLHVYTNAIIDIGTENGMGWSEGIGMFLANIRNAGDPKLPYYTGADDIDYGALKPDLPGFEENVQALIDDYRANQTEIIRLRGEEKFDAVTRLMCRE